MSYIFQHAEDMPNVKLQSLFQRMLLQPVQSVTKTNVIIEYVPFKRSCRDLPYYIKNLRKIQLVQIIKEPTMRTRRAMPLQNDKVCWLIVTKYGIYMKPKNKRKWMKIPHQTRLILQSQELGHYSSSTLAPMQTKVHLQARNSHPVAQLGHPSPAEETKTKEREQGWQKNSQSSEIHKLQEIFRNTS